jgi:isoleucyl-tRNA synthetase
VAKLAAPIAPFYSEKLYTDLNRCTQREKYDSVHLADFPVAQPENIDKDLEEKMELAQQISSMVLSLRRKVNIKVRQPLHKILIPATDPKIIEQINAVKNLILTEVNVKDIEFIKDTKGVLVKRIKPNFKTLGPKYGKLMKGITTVIGNFTQDDIYAFEEKGGGTIVVDGQTIPLTLEDVEIISEDIPGWLVASEDKVTVALDIKITEELRQEGIARELINRIQNIRKESNFDVTDKIKIEIVKHDAINDAIENHRQYISSQTLAASLDMVDEIVNDNKKLVELDDEIQTFIRVERISAN